jgi:hypothetical protein
MSIPTIDTSPMMNIDTTPTSSHIVHIDPMGSCRPIGSNNNHNNENESENTTPVFHLCAIDNCIVSSGMLSRNIPAMTYGMFVCLTTILSFFLVDINNHNNNNNNIEELLRISAERKMGIAAVHANWIDGNHMKMARMKEYGLWLAELYTNGSYSCNQYQPVTLQTLNSKQPK